MKTLILLSTLVFSTSLMALEPGFYRGAHPAVSDYIPLLEKASLSPFYDEDLIKELSEKEDHKIQTLMKYDRSYSTYVLVENTDRIRKYYNDLSANIRRRVKNLSAPTSLYATVGGVVQLHQIYIALNRLSSTDEDRRRIKEKLILKVDTGSWDSIDREQDDEGNLVVEIDYDEDDFEIDDRFDFAVQYRRRHGNSTVIQMLPEIRINHDSLEAEYGFTGQTYKIDPDTKEVTHQFGLGRMEEVEDLGIVSHHDIFREIRFVR